MTAQIIDGKKVAGSVRANLKEKVQQLTRNGQRPPCLAVILVGDNPASAVYVRNKVKACEETGIRSILKKLPADTEESTLLGLIDEMNNDESIDGILVQLPLPPHLEERKVIKKISASKDVDGFHLENVGALSTGIAGFRPCTPQGIMTLLKRINCKLEGKNALVIGRSNIVGKPMAMMLLEENATVTIAHSRTKNLKELALNSDVIVVAVGKRNVLTKDMVKPGVVVIDVGMNRNDEGKLCGDVDFAGVSEVASWITPVPGGVGPMTIAMLLLNTIESYLRKSIV